MAETTYIRAWSKYKVDAASGIGLGEVHQLPDGRAGIYVYVESATGPAGPASTGDDAIFETSGKWTVPKTTSVVITKGQPLYWDHSANTATYAPASDRDFFLGAALADGASADTTIGVDLNVWPNYKIEWGRNRGEDEFLTVIVKTVVGSTTVEVPDLKMRGATGVMILGATAEAQKVDALSQQSFAVESNWIVEGGFNIVDDGDATAIDFNIGVANATHASDADSITESCFLHLDGNTLDLFAESDDGTTEVAATDTTVNIVLSTPVHFVIDGRNTSDIQIYVNGVLMLGSTVFKLNAATGPLKLLAHLEKSSDATTGDYRFSYLRVRTMEQD